MLKFFEIPAVTNLFKDFEHMPIDALFLKSKTTQVPMFIHQQDGIANYPKAKQQNSTCSLTEIYWGRNKFHFKAGKFIGAVRIHMTIIALPGPRGNTVKLQLQFN